MADNVTTAWKFLRGKGLTPAQAAGVIGSMQGESGKGLDPKARNPNGGAFGIAQWLGGRKAALMARGNPTSLNTQLQHLWSELKGPESGALRGLKAAHTPEAAAVAWQRLFERGAPFEQKYDQRAANARGVFSRLSGTPGGPVGVDTGGAPASSTTTRRLISPAVDNEAARAALVYSFLSPARERKDLLGFVGQAQALQDVPAQYATDTRTTLASAAQSAQSARGAQDTSGTDIGGKSPLLELIHKAPRGPGYAVKNGQVVSGPGVYGAVWDGHADHVHVAAGPETIVKLGRLARKMGLRVSENPHFGGVSAVHVPGSYHYKGEAIDVGGDPVTMDRYAAKVERIYGLRGKRG